MSEGIINPCSKRSFLFLSLLGQFCGVLSSKFSLGLLRLLQSYVKQIGIRNLCVGNRLFWDFTDISYMQYTSLVMAGQEPCDLHKGNQA